MSQKFILCHPSMYLKFLLDVGFSLRNIEKKTGVSRPVLSRYLNDETKTWRSDIAVALRNLANATAGDLQSKHDSYREATK